MAETPGEELARRLERYPKEALSFFDSAFATAATVPPEVRRQVLREVVDSFTRGTRRLDGSTLRAVTSLSAREAEEVASVYSVVIGLLSEFSATPDEFVTRAKGILFSPEQEQIARSIAVSICEARPGIDGIVERAQLAGEVLPSLDTFDIVVDVRIRVVDGIVKTFVPVAIVHIDTDVAVQEMFLQMSRGDVETAIRKLTTCLDEMKMAEKLSFRKNS